MALTLLLLLYLAIIFLVAQGLKKIINIPLILRLPIALIILLIIYKIWPSIENFFGFSL